MWLFIAWRRPRGKHCSFSLLNYFVVRRDHISCDESSICSFLHQFALDQRRDSAVMLTMFGPGRRLARKDNSKFRRRTKSTRARATSGPLAKLRFHLQTTVFSRTNTGHRHCQPQSAAFCTEAGIHLWTCRSPLIGSRLTGRVHDRQETAIKRQQKGLDMEPEFRKPRLRPLR
jgi:hypothetical protein